MRGSSAVLLACGVVAGLGCRDGLRPAREGPLPSSPGRDAHATAAGPRTGSNVTRDDYVGSTACAPCHPGVAATWERSPMHGMTRDGQRAEVHAPFDGTRFRFKNDTVVLESRVGQRVMRLEPSTGPSETYRITRVIGGRTREDFVGVDADRGGDELVLPVSFLRGPGTLRYKGYSVMVHERENLRAGPVWRKTCIFCHNTVPEVDRLLSALGGPGAPAYQGESVDRWLPRERRARVEVSDPRGFEAALQGEVTRLGGGDLAVGDSVVVEARGAIAAVRAGFDATSLVEMGVGCEACHGGGREHVAEPTRHPSFTPTAPWLDVETPDGGRAQAVNRVCARCHQVLFSRYPFTWEGGRRDAAAGGSHISSGEARDFLLGGCAGALTCTTCHDPHGGSDRGILTSLATPQGNAVCVGCHRELAGREALQAHSHHRPDGLGAACVSCHMPRKNMGLEGRLTPYHRIGTPTEPARVLGDRPLECALCHADRSVRSLVDAMESFWKARYPRPRLEELYGSLDANVLSATLERGKPHEKAVAMATLGANRARDAVPLIARELTSEYPLVREWALDALRSITGACDVDLAADRATIARRAAECAGPSAARPLPASPPSLEPRRRSEPREEEPED